MLENLTPQEVQQVLHSTSRRVRILIFKRDECPNCAFTLGQARRLQSSANVYTTDVDSFQDILAAAPKIDALRINNLLRRAAAMTTVLPLILRIAPDGGVKMNCGAMDAAALFTFMK